MNPCQAKLAEKLCWMRKLQAAYDICYIHCCVFSLKHKCLWRGRLWVHWICQCDLCWFSVCAFLRHGCNHLLPRETVIVPSYEFSDRPSITSMWTECYCRKNAYVHFASAFINHVTMSSERIWYSLSGVDCCLLLLMSVCKRGKSEQQFPSFVLHNYIEM